MRYRRGVRPSPFRELDLNTLLAHALEEQQRAGPHDPIPYLAELHSRPSGATFSAAVTLLDQGGERRKLGLRILKELGANRPFADDALDLLLPQVERAQSAADLRELVSTIGNQGSARALPLLCALADHEDVLVRFLVAQHLPACMWASSDQPDARAIEALLRLLRDDDADVRYYAAVVFADDYPALDGTEIRRALAALANDPDDQVRDAARRALADRNQ